MENGSMKREGADKKKAGKTKGGIITMPFIFGNEICEKLAVAGFNVNMISYLTQQLHFPLTKAANTLTNFGGTASLMPLIGAFLADAYVGRFWTITVASIIYQIGMTLLTMSAILPTLRPPKCEPNGQTKCQEASTSQLAILYVSLLLASIGAGGIKPCVVAFGADQFDETDPAQKTKIWKFFNWYYFCIGASFLVAVTVIVYIQDNVSWGLGLGVPTVAMFLAIVVFIVGYPLYRKLDPTGSPFTRLVQVSVAAFKKRNLDLVSDDLGCLYENDELDAHISVNGRLVHTKQMRFLDKAALITEQDNLNSPNPWNLNTIHRVEELKSIIRMAPIWSAGILLFTAYAQQSTFSLQQARTMDRHLTKNFQIPPGSMPFFTLTFMLITIAIYDQLFIPIARRFTGLDRGITFLHRMAIGFVFSIFATLVAGFVEIKRRNVALEHDLMDKPNAILPIHVLWLVPQYGLHGVAEAFTSIGHLEFFYDQAPESMRSTAMALSYTAGSMGYYFSTVLVWSVHRFSASPDGSNWLPDNNLNKGKLEYFYWVITFLQVMNLVYYAICAKFYMLKPVEVRKVAEEGGSGGDHGGGGELGSHA